jgi:hypothetical protein
MTGRAIPTIDERSFSLKREPLNRMFETALGIRTVFAVAAIAEGSLHICKVSSEILEALIVACLVVIYLVVVHCFYIFAIIILYFIKRSPLFQ